MTCPIGVSCVIASLRKRKKEMCVSLEHNGQVQYGTDQKSHLTATHPLLFSQRFCRAVRNKKLGSSTIISITYIQFFFFF